jgi:hypothetical protein
VDKKKKELKKEYQQNHTPMGVYQIHNIANDKPLIGTALKSQQYGERGYNQKKKGTEERLRLIAQNRSNQVEPVRED